jgi:hypothetical protein
MEVRIRVSCVDQGTQHLEEVVRIPFERVGRELSSDFGPGLDHLWMDVELSPVVADHRPPYSFRFQKRVKPRAHFLPKSVFEELNLPTCYNVGHCSVRPDYFDLAKVPLKNAAAYLLGRVYESTMVLERRQRTFPKFRVSEFRDSFRRLVDSQSIEI